MPTFYDVRPYSSPYLHFWLQFYRSAVSSIDIAANACHFHPAFYLITFTLSQWYLLASLFGICYFLRLRIVYFWGAVEEKIVVLNLVLTKLSKCTISNTRRTKWWCMIDKVQHAQPAIRTICFFCEVHQFAESPKTGKAVSSTFIVNICGCISWRFFSLLNEIVKTCFCLENDEPFSNF